MAFKFSPLLNINDLRDIVDGAAPYGIEPNEKVSHGLHLYEVLMQQTISAVPAVKLIDLTEEQAVEHAFQVARVRAIAFPGQPAINMIAANLQDQVVKETAEAMADDASRYIKELRPVFDEAADHLARSVKAGITPTSTAQDVLDLNSQTAATLWNELPTHITSLERIKNLRVRLSRTLGLPPQPFYTNSDPITDYTACFVHPDTGITSGAITNFPNNATGQRVFNTPKQEWLSLATITAGNMQLN
ncbi:hypothetical protein ACTAQJ_07975 [Arthrobacter sp. alpha11c]